MKVRKRVTGDGRRERRTCFNGAAPVKVRKPATDCADFADGERLQWGRTREGAETVTGGTYTLADLGLQWGRTREGAETCSDTIGYDAYPRFNGAAPVKVRKLVV